MAGIDRAERTVRPFGEGRAPARLHRISSLKNAILTFLLQTHGSACALKHSPSTEPRAKQGAKENEYIVVTAIQDLMVLDQVAVQDYWFSCWLYKAKRHF